MSLAAFISQLPQIVSLLWKVYVWAEANGGVGKAHEKVDAAFKSLDTAKTEDEYYEAARSIGALGSKSGSGSAGDVPK